VSPYQAAGLAGAFLFLAAYAGAQTGKLDPQKLPALLINLAGAILILISMIEDFNLGAFVLESAWGLIAFAGLVRLAVKRKG
jgi:hypothetical protein